MKKVIGWYLHSESTKAFIGSEAHELIAVFITLEESPFIKHVQHYSFGMFSK